MKHTKGTKTMLADEKATFKSRSLLERNGWRLQTIDYRSHGRIRKRREWPFPFRVLP